MPASGSSSSSTFGSLASAIAISSWRWAPWLSTPAVVRSCPDRPTRASAAHAASMSDDWLCGVERMERAGSLTACTPRRTFSNTDSDLRMLVRWNERDTPRRGMSNGRVPVMSRPSRWSLPLVGVSCPDRRLTNVDLPAPFGPMTACSSRAFSVSVTSRTARRPPNDLDRPSVARMPAGASAMDATLRRRIRRLRRGWATVQSGEADADEPVAKQDHDHEDDDAFDQQLAFGNQLGGLAKAVERERADDRAGERTNAAQQNSEQGLRRLLPSNQFGIHESRVQAPH